MRHLQANVLKRIVTPSLASLAQARFEWRCLPPLAALTLMLAWGIAPAAAQDATWLAAPATADYSTGTNWSTGTVPVGTAFFTGSTTTTLTFSNPATTIGAFDFNALVTYTFVLPANITFTGAGIQVHSGAVNLNAGSGHIDFLNGSSADHASIAIGLGALSFHQTSTAGSANITDAGGGGLLFLDHSTAANSSITNSVGAVLFTDNAAAGTATVTNSGTLEFAGTGTAASAIITNSGTGNTIFFQHSTADQARITNSAAATITFADSATAASAIISANLGTINFHDNSTAGNATITNGGTLAFDDNSTAATANVTNNNTLSFLTASTADHATIANNSALHFQNSTTAANANVTNSGTVDFANTSTAGQATITNNAPGTVTFHDTTTAGNAVINSSVGATTNFFDASTAGNATISNDGHLNFLNSGTAGSAQITNNATGLVSVQNSATAGNANINNLGTLSFVGTSTAGSATIAIANSAFANFSVNSTAGNAQITTNSGGHLSFTNASTAGNATVTTNSGGNTMFINNAEGGSARLITNAGGVVDFSGTTGALGNRVVGVGSLEGAGRFQLGRNELTVGGNNLSTEVSGTIEDGGSFAGTFASLTKVGAGTLTLSGANTYTGFTTVNGGALIVNGSLAPTAAAVTVNNGGLLGGSGSVSPVTITAGGTLAPGGAASAMSVNGPLFLLAGANYMVQVMPTWSGRANVTGAANIAGAAQAVFGAGSNVASHSIILNATGGVTGTFTGLTTNLAANTTSLSYDANNVFLNVSSPFAGVSGLNQNQRNVSNALNSVFNSTGSLPIGLFNLSPSGLSQVSGEAGTGSIQSAINAAGQFLNALLDPFIASRGAGMGQAGAASSYAEGAPRDARDAYAAVKAAPRAGDLYSNRWSVWGTSYGGSGTTEGNTTVGSHDTTSRVFGLVAGADYRFSPDLLAGFALGGGGTSFSLAEGLGHGSADLFQAGAFASQKFGAAYISGALAYGWQDVTTNRTLSVAGVDQLQARFNANTFSGRFEGGYRYVTPLAGITPYAAVQVTSFVLPNYGERAILGTSPIGLNYGSQTTTATRTEFGARFDRSYALETAILTLRGRTAWAHDFDNSRAITATFQSLPGASFVVNGARPSADAALISAGADLVWTNGFSLAGTFEGEFSNTVTSYAGKGTLRYAW